MAQGEEINYVPIPVGELIEWLGTNGFDISVPHIDRFFFVIKKHFSAGMPLSRNAYGDEVIDEEQKQVLKNLTGPIFVTSESEQKRFSEVLDRFPKWIVPWSLAAFIKNLTGEKEKKHAATQLAAGQRRAKMRLRLLVPLAAIVFIWAAFTIFAVLNVHQPHLRISATDGKVPRSKLIGIDSIEAGAHDTVKWQVDKAVFFYPVSHRFTYAFKTDGWHKIVAFREVPDPRAQAIFLKRKIVLEDSLPVSVDTKPEKFGKKYNPQALPLLMMPEKTIPQYSTFNLLFWFSLLLTCLLILYFLLHNQRSKVRRNQHPPLKLFLPGQEHLIYNEDTVGAWVQQMLMREESLFHHIDIGKSIQKSIRSGGLKQLVLEPVKKKPQYLFLIDYKSPADQQVKAIYYLVKQLLTREIELSYFFFRGDPRYCRDEKLEKDFELEKLQSIYPDARLILITDGTRLVDFQKQEVVDWVPELLQNWKEKAILTPLNLFSWGALEDILSGYFIVLPLAWNGRSELVNFFNLTYVPDTRETGRLLKSNNVKKLNPAYWQKVTTAEIEAYFIMSGAKQQVYPLVQWAIGMMLYPMPTWEITITIGKAIESFFPKEKLVTIEHLLCITGLPWLKQSLVSTDLRKTLLPELNKDFKQKIIDDITRLFKSVSPVIGKDSVAYEELLIRSMEIIAHSSDQGMVKKSLTGLMQYLHTGLLKDEIIRETIVRRKRYRSILQLLLVGGLIVVCALLKLTFRFNIIRNAGFLPDSAIFYNNKAVEITTKDFKVSKEQTYRQAQHDLNRSLFFRKTFTAYYNLEVLKYDFGIQLSRQNKDLRDNIIFSKEDRSEMTSLMQPMRTLLKDDSDCVLQPTDLREYLRFKYKQVPPADVLKFLLGADEFKGKKIAMDKKAFLLGYAAIPAASLTSSQFITKDQFKINRLAMSTDKGQTDSLLTIKALNIILFYGGVKQPIIDTCGHCVPSPNQVAMLHIKRIFSGFSIPFGIDVNSLFSALNRINVTKLTSANLASATECDIKQKEEIHYYWLYFKDLTNKDTLFRRFSFLPLSPNSGSYIIYFFKNSKLFQIELRLNITDFDYEKFLIQFNIRSAIKSNDRFYFNDGKTYTSVSNDQWLHYKRVIFGDAKYAKYCGNDFWNR